MSTEEHSKDSAVLLTSARTRAAALLKHLQVQQAEMEANPPRIPAEDLIAGREAMAKAVAAAGRAVAAIDAAIAVAEAELQLDDSDGSSP